MAAPQPAGGPSARRSPAPVWWRVLAGVLAGAALVIAGVGLVRLTVFFAAWSNGTLNLDTRGFSTTSVPGKELWMKAMLGAAFGFSLYGVAAVVPAVVGCVRSTIAAKVVAGTAFAVIALLWAGCLVIAALGIVTPLI